MIHIRKRQRMGCAVAAAAMLSGRRYEEVAAHWPDLDEARMRFPQELCALLQAVTDHEWHLIPCWNKPRLRAFVPPQRPVAIWIQDALFRPRFGQWIVLEDKVVHDPGEMAESPMSNYARRDWLVGFVADSVLPDEFARLQRRKRAQGEGVSTPRRHEEP